jgi:hypothetical protein
LSFFFFSYVIIENPVVSVAYAIRPHKFGYSPRSVREKQEDKQRFASLFLFVRTMQNAVMLIVKPRFAVAGPAVAGCGLWGPHMKALRPAIAKRGFTPCKDTKFIRKSQVFNGLFSNYFHLFPEINAGKNLKTKGRICLLPARFMRILQSLRETLLSPSNFSKQPTPDENNLYQGKP